MRAPDWRLYKRLARPFLFLFPPEKAWRAADFALGWEGFWTALASGLSLRVDAPRLEVEWCGMKLGNPVGLAAGFDKDCRRLPSLAALGFGYVVCGTVTLGARLGNPRPRMVRLAAEESLLNAMGFPSRGLEAAAARIEATRSRMSHTPVAVSISGTEADDIVQCHRRLDRLADAVEVNISSPNTADLRVFHQRAPLRRLLDAINESRRGRLLVKLPPYSDPRPPQQERDRMAALVGACIEAGVDGLTVANSRPVTDPRLATGSGGLSGRSIFPATLTMVRDVRAQAGSDIAINASGGISTGAHAWDALQAGANTLQVYTGFVYDGPGIAKRINNELLRIMDGHAERRQARSPRSAARGLM